MKRHLQEAIQNRGRQLDLWIIFEEAQRRPQCELEQHLHRLEPVRLWRVGRVKHAQEPLGPVVLQARTMAPEHDSKEERDTQREKHDDADRQDHVSVVAVVEALEAVVGNHVVGSGFVVELFRATELFDKLAVEEIQSGHDAG